MPKKNKKRVSISKAIKQFHSILEAVVAKVWKRFRENFRKALAKRKMASKSGAGAQAEGSSSCAYLLVIFNRYNWKSSHN